MIVRTKPNRSEAGMTTLGMVVFVSFVGLFVFAGLRLTPVYLNYMKVVGVVDGVHQEFDGQGATAGEIRKSILRRWDIEDIKILDDKDVTVRVADGGIEVIAAYDHPQPFIANVSFSVHFDKRTLIRR